MKLPWRQLDLLSASHLLNSVRSYLSVKVSKTLFDVGEACYKAGRFAIFGNQIPTFPI